MKFKYVDYRVWVLWDIYMFIKYMGYVVKSILMEFILNICSCLIDLGLFYVFMKV